MLLTWQPPGVPASPRVYLKRHPTFKCFQLLNGCAHVSLPREQIVFHGLLVEKRCVKKNMCMLHYVNFINQHMPDQLIHHFGWFFSRKKMTVLMQSELPSSSEFSTRIMDKVISVMPWILIELQQFPANAILSVATNRCSTGLNSQSSASGNQAECTIWQIDAHFDANVTSLSLGTWKLWDMPGIKSIVRSKLR